ncbi:MAG: hypothetical protein ACK55Y_15240, partial [Pseudanabaena sp.]
NQFIATLLVNLIIAIATLPLWLGLERVWLKQLAQVFGYPIQRYEVDHPLTTTTNRKKFRNHIYCHPHIQDEVICPRCSYPTVIRVTPKQTRKSKKFPKQGSQEATAILQCQNCFHEEPVYPYVAPVSSSSYFSDYSSSYDSSSSSSSYDSYDYGSSSSSSDFGGGGSDFGGGGSDGGGAGSDW